MKLPSIQQMLHESGRTLRRFPFVLADAAVGTVAALILVDYGEPPPSSVLYPMLFAAVLGFPLFLASALVAERQGWRKSTALGVHVVCVFLLIGYALTVPSDMTLAPLLHVERLWLIGLALCLLVATAPFAVAGQLNGFWQYNKSLLQRILLTGLFSLTLDSGLAIAMVSVEQLFGVDIPGKRYGELGVLILGIFATWFFLADVPEDLDGLESRTDYPRFLRVFGQYILSPMLIVYFVILYAYIAKIAIEWNWPKGLVSGPIFGFAAIGISAYLILHPLRDKSEYSWIKTAARWFWIVMIPMIVVLQLAIWRRVSEYGITENRYFAFAIGLWLVVMVVYFLVSRTKSIKVIPASMCGLLLLMSVGPWGAFSVSERSQVGRLKSLLTTNQLLIDGRVREAQGQVSSADAAQISSIVRYLHEIHGYDEIQPWFTESLARDSAGLGSVPLEPAAVVNSLGIEYARYPGSRGRGFGELTADLKRAIDIEGYDHLLVAQHLSAETPEFGCSTDGIVCRIDTNLDVLTMRMVEGGATVDSAQVRLRPLVDSLLEAHNGIVGDAIPLQRMSIQPAAETMKLKVVVHKIEFRRKGDEIHPVAYEAVVLSSRIGK
jgi:hypothetical protein